MVTMQHTISFICALIACSLGVASSAPLAGDCATPQCDAAGDLEDWTGLLQLARNSNARLEASPSAQDEANASTQGPGGKAPSKEAAQALGWPKCAKTTSGDDWCRGEVPSEDWTLKAECLQDDKPQEVRVLDYNLYWWNLFGERKGNKRSAGKLIEASHKDQPFDVIGFQECEDSKRILSDARLNGTFRAIKGPHATVIAYRSPAWELLADGKAEVAEDEAVKGQYFGKRAVAWARLRSNTTGKVVFFANHHGPLRVNSGGKCGGEAVAYSILKLIALNARKGDLIVLTGDFNADRRSKTIQTLSSRLFNHFSGRSLGGIDHILSSCNRSFVSSKNHGTGGSDHDAISAVFRF